MSYDPIFSPWGNIQTRRTLCPGVFEVSTAGHGGIMAEKQAVSRIFSEAAQKCGFWERGYLCFEEDCDAQVALRELMDRGLFTAPVNQHSFTKYQVAVRDADRALTENSTGKRYQKQKRKKEFENGFHQEKGR